MSVCSFLSATAQAPQASGVCVKLLEVVATMRLQRNDFHFGAAIHSCEPLGAVLDQNGLLPENTRLMMFDDQYLTLHCMFLQILTLIFVYEYCSIYIYMCVIMCI